MSRAMHYWILRSTTIRNSAATIIGALPLNEDMLEVIVRPYVKSKSRQQENLAHMWYSQIANQAGWSPEAVKDAMKRRFLPIITVPGPDGDVEILTSTAGLKCKEYSDYLRNIELFAAEWGIDLTYPADYAWIMGQRAAA